MALGNVPPEEIGSPHRNKDVPSEILRVAEEIDVRSRLIGDRGVLRDMLEASDSRREKIKFEIRNDVNHFRNELRNLRDYKDQLSPKALEAIKQVETDLNTIDSYIDDAWPASPYGFFLTTSTPSTTPSSDSAQSF